MSAPRVLRPDPIPGEQPATTLPVNGQVAPAEVAARLGDLQDVLANQRLEGLEVDAETVAQLERVARGELTTDDVIADVHARIARGAL